MPPPRLYPLGDRALVVEFGQGIDAAVNARVHALAALLDAEPLPGVVDLIPAYATLTLVYAPSAFADAGRAPYDTLCGHLRARLARLEAWTPPPAHTVEIPVCYGGEYGPDLDEVARHAGLAAEEVVARHAAPRYRVYLLGFAPGYPYLGGLDPRLAAPRRATPRRRCPAGSVAIGGEQTGVYPLETPGGWNLIGRTPRRLFLPGAEPPCLLAAGDEVRFVPITPAQYAAWSAA